MLKKLVFLGTGGTIAGMASSAGDNVGYKAAQVGVDQLLAAIPTLALAVGDWAVAFEQVAQVDSKDMGWAQWRALAQRVQHQTSQTDVAALIITHGTDTLEETAFFLSQVLPAAVQSKPVVLTCAMRPASSLTPDGPQNVLDAVAVARSVHARGCWRCAPVPCIRPATFKKCIPTGTMLLIPGMPGHWLMWKRAWCAGCMPAR